MSKLKRPGSNWRALKAEPGEGGFGPPDKLRVSRETFSFSGIFFPYFILFCFW